GESSDAASSQPSGQCRREMHGEHLSGALSPVRAAPWAQPNGQHHRPPTVPINLEEDRTSLAVRGTRAGHERTIQATPSEEYDPGAPKPWVPHRIRQCSIDPPAYFRPCTGSIFQVLYRRYVPRLGHNQTVSIIAHRLCRLIWK